jgi:hypothetical protein
MPNLNIKIILQDDLSASWIAWFDGLHVERTENNSTCLSGEIADQSALHGLLERIRDLNLHLVSVQVQASSQEGTLKPSWPFAERNKNENLD